MPYHQLHRKPAMHYRLIRSGRFWRFFSRLDYLFKLVEVEKYEVDIIGGIKRRMADMQPVEHTPQMPRLR